MSVGSVSRTMREARRKNVLNDVCIKKRNADDDDDVVMGWDGIVTK